METSKFKTRESRFKTIYLFPLLLLLLIIPKNSFAHCDSYDGPVIQDALKALDQKNVELVYKWISEDQEKEIDDLFKKSLKYRNNDKEVYQLLEKHFLETLVRLHREGEGAAYTGLKPAGSTSAIIRMTDAALNENDIDLLQEKLNAIVKKLITEKYEVVASLKNVKDDSIEQGRAYVAAYVDYTHTIEALHKVLEHGAESYEGHEL